jgi:hypothetical protein
MSGPKERWIQRRADFGESPAIDAFLADVIEVCKRHGLSIGHEDQHGGFVVSEYDEGCSEWLRNASDDTKGDDHA